MSKASLEDKKEELSKETGKKRRLTKSKLRRTLESLQKLEPLALKHIEDNLSGKKVEKEMLNTAKWIIQQTQSLSRAAVADELETNNLRFRAIELAQQDGEPEEEDVVEEVKSPRFSLHVLPTTKDL